MRSSSEKGSPAAMLPVMLMTFVIVIAQSPAAADNAVIRKVPEGKTAAVPSFARDGQVWVSMTDFAEQAGFKHTASVFGNRLTFTNEHGRLSFVRDNPFYTVDTATAILPHPPVRRESKLYLPARSLVGAFGGKYPGMLSWDEKSSAIIVNTLNHNILTIAGEVKQNGTVVSIALADSLRYEHTYVHPNLVINFLNGKIGREAMRRTVRSGVIDSAFTVQYDGSAQISLILNQTIEPPHIDYNRSNRTLMLSLKPRVEQQKAAPAQVPVDMSLIRTVVIDPGHGGKDPGAIGPTGVMEKTVTLGIALELKKMLERAGLAVHMTRDRDVFVPLRDRTNFANEKKADLFVSIHANAIGDKRRQSTMRGYKIYFLSQAKNEEDKMAAMRENAVVELEDTTQRQNYDALQDVLISIAGAEYLRESQELSIMMEQTFGASPKRIPRAQLGVGQANFWVLNGAYMPAVLVETGYISHPEEEKLLADKRIQFQLATALSESIIKFKRMVEAGQ